MLKENEEALLRMPFEVMLTQVVNLPTKFLITSEARKPEEEAAALQRFDKTMKSIKVPTMLLERLKREFDNNYKLSGVIQSSPEKLRR